MEIITLSFTQYKEKSAIINAISSEGAISFLARGILAPKSKNLVLTNPLSIFDVSFQEGNFKYPMLKESKTLFLSRKINENYEYLSTLQFVTEITSAILQDEDKAQAFIPLKETVLFLKENGNTLLASLYYMNRLLKINGFGFEVNQCVFCGTKKEIVAFSFQDGGFICKKCFEENENESEAFSKNQMLLIRAICNAKTIESLKGIVFEQEDAKIIFNKFIEFIDSALGFHLKTASLINN